MQGEGGVAHKALFDTTRNTQGPVAADFIAEGVKEKVKRVYVCA
jgi:hypothetical protein